MPDGQTNRRAFIAGLGGAAVWPLAARAQRIERAPRVGVLLGSYTAADQAGQARIGTFLRALRELGWEDGRNLRIDYRWGERQHRAKQRARSGAGSVRAGCHRRHERSSSGGAS